ncbi:MAG: hypothetical protein O3C35_00680 [Proteobacteria bacterium]|nr:hypothetical protein [Pseudomonadota bacterium]
MNFYIAHILNSNCDAIHLYNASDKSEPKKLLNSINELFNIKNVDQLLVLIPAAEVTSYKFIKNKSLSDQINTANFISDIDVNLIDSVSNNEYFLTDKAAYIVNKNFITNLNKQLSNLNNKVFITPEYLINSSEHYDSITQIEDTFMFSYEDKTGFAVSNNNLNQYLDIISNEKPDFNPEIFSTDRNLNNKYQSSKVIKKFDLQDISIEKIISLPNFFKMNLTPGLLIKKMNLTKIQLAASILSLLFILFTPYYLIYNNNYQSQIYRDATLNIFSSISKDIKRVVAPKNQIDQILKNTPTILQAQTNLPDLELFFRYGENYFSEITIDPQRSSAKITIDSMPSFQFNILKSTSEKFNIKILEENIDIKDGNINGIINLKYENN